MKYSERYRVHYYYTDRNFELKLFYLAKYMQETALAAYDLLEEPRQELCDKGLAFFLAKISFRFWHEIKKFDEIRIETWALPPKSVGFVRNYRIFNETSGTYAAAAASSWALVNLGNHGIVHPKSLSESFVSLSTDAEELGFEPVRRLGLPDEGEAVWEPLLEKEVFYNDIDENLHMNNTVYLDLAQNALWKAYGGALPGRLAALDFSYDVPVAEGDRIFVWALKTSGQEGDTIYLRGKSGGAHCFGARAVFESPVK